MLDERKDITWSISNYLNDEASIKRDFCKIKYMIKLL